jgi:hypothetical protein
MQLIKTSWVTKVFFFFLIFRCWGFRGVGQVGCGVFVWVGGVRCLFLVFLLNAIFVYDFV